MFERCPRCSSEWDPISNFCDLCQIGVSPGINGKWCFKRLNNCIVYWGPPNRTEIRIRPSDRVIFLTKHLPFDIDEETLKRYLLLI